MAMTNKERAIADNYAAFEKLLPGLLESAEGKYALLRDRQLVGLFDTGGEAHFAGAERFDDGLFSVQKVKQGAVSLGFFSYARYCRAS
jgi:hypothetical protein